MSSYQARKDEITKLRAQLQSLQVAHRDLWALFDAQHNRYADYQVLVKELYSLLIANGITPKPTKSLQSIESELVSDEESFAEITRRLSETVSI